ncbi:trans-aconitate 2-methyltransferase [Roseivirga sp. E12]|uniref:class I SAM-dependent methyltransferase n=1 Tax=Roseivirga sp. E12 TaxID=2819237 RepID=UPI001ABD18F5|nr:class I SAM-dependent methyltransferase [Roseivirga sp. E12]MBO3698380.1 class I SAM-dependent methyltransferase [Roseivirga sp. E12]
MSKITEDLKAHYAKKFEEFGATSEGVDWGPKEKAAMRYEAMLDVLLEGDRSGKQQVSMLDIGAGYGGQYEFMLAKGYGHIQFTGVDVVKEMVDFGNQKYPEATFINGDFLSMPVTERYDYLTCNGILTQKLSATDSEMHDYMEALVAKMFQICHKGIAFNTMTSYVDYQMDGNFHNDPSELLKILFKHTRHVKLNHAYPLYEYTAYMYK